MNLEESLRIEKGTMKLLSKVMIRFRIKMIRKKILQILLLTLLLLT